LPRFSRFVGRLRIGADFFERIGARTEPAAAPRGVVDRIEDLANPAIEVARIHPAVVAFFEDTGGLDLVIRSRWRFPFSISWAIFRHVMRWVGQFVLPLREGRIATRVHGLDAARDGRSDARAVIRTYVDGGDVMQAVAYATWERDATRYMSAAFPLPGGHVAGILRLDANGEDDGGGRTTTPGCGSSWDRSPFDLRSASASSCGARGRRALRPRSIATSSPERRSWGGTPSASSGSAS
jgi:hypothetical protein